MHHIDTVFGLDWSDARHIGDGVYLLDCTTLPVPFSLALRTDRGLSNHVIALEQEVFDDLVSQGNEILAARLMRD